MSCLVTSAPYQSLTRKTGFRVGIRTHLPSFDFDLIRLNRSKRSCTLRVKAFFEQIKDPYTSSQIPPNDHLQTVMDTSEDSVADQDSDEIQSPPEKDDSDSAINERPIIMGKTFSRPLLEFIYVIQFRHLCLKAKIPLVLYTFPSSPEIQTLFALITPDAVPFPKHALSRRMVSSNCSDSESDEVSSPERKISKKDYYLINTMMKLHESMDRSSLKQTLKREEKEG